MKNSTLFGALLVLILFSRPLAADQWHKTYALNPYIGPEIYYVKRLKEGGSTQGGTVYGIRIGYDHVRRYKFYWGIDALWAQGTLTGHRKKETLEGAVFTEHLKSLFTDMNVEARIGYTFQTRHWRCASLTPYTGLGYFWERNFYQHPSPLHIHFKNHFSYVPIGFLSQIFITPVCSVGVNFKARYLLESEQKVERDPSHGKLTLHYEEKFQYRVELPFNYYFCFDCHPLAVSLSPFFEYRPYGHRANFPFDFLEVKLKLYGATLKFHYLF